jgi:hypothetical protein
MSEVFVFGSNRQGRHGRGAAKEALRRWGATYGVPAGRQGQAYGIVTKELRPHFPPVTLEEVQQGVERFLEYAKAHPEDTFLVTPIGCGLAGFKEDQIRPLFVGSPANVKLPLGWG